MTSPRFSGYVGSCLGARRVWRVLGAAALAVSTSVVWAIPAQQDPPQKPPTPAPDSRRDLSRDDFQGVLFLIGKVLMEDGGPIPGFLQIHLSCQGRIIEQTRVMSDGTFTFELGAHKPPSFMDASASGSSLPGLGQTGRGLAATTGTNNVKGAERGRVDLTGCDIRVGALAGYDSNTLTLGRMSVFDTEVGTIYIHPMNNVTGTSVSANTLAAPKNALKAFEKGRNELRKEKVNHSVALKELQQATRLYPQFSEAWLLLGEVQFAQGDPVRARESFRKAIESDAKFVFPYIGLAGLEVEQDRWAEAAELSKKAVELNPYIPQAQYLRALSSFQMGQYEETEQCIQMLHISHQDKQYPLLHYLMGAINATRGNITLAAKEFRRFLELPVPAQSLVDTVRNQLLEWEQQGLIDKALDSRPPLP